MSDDDDSEGGDAARRNRLRALEEKIAAAKGPPKAVSGGESHYSQAGLAWRMVTELVAGLGIGAVMGYGLDVLLGTAPILMVVFIGLGFAAGIRVMLRTAQEVTNRAADGDAPDARETKTKDEG